MRLILSLLLLISLTACHETELRAVKVTKFFDGDSFVVQDYPCFECKEFQVRLLGIDAPEFKQRPWGERSQAQLKSLIRKDRVIFLEYDIQKQDKYKRHLAYVYADEERTRFVNKEMIETGYAELYALAKDLKYLDDFKEAERLAKQNTLGIWDSKNGLKLSPYKYRKQHRS